MRSVVQYCHTEQVHWLERHCCWHSGHCFQPQLVDAGALCCRYDAFADLLLNRTAATQYVTLNYKAANSVDKAVGDSISSDLYLVAISVVIFIVLAVVFMSR